MISFIHLDISLYNLQRIYHICNLINLFFLPKFLFDKLIKFLFVRLWNEIPDFCSTKMIVINWVNPGIFNMPTKGWKHHSNVDPWNANASNILSSVVTNVEKWFLGSIHIIKIIHILRIVKILIFGFTGKGSRKCTAIFVYRKVSSILHRNLILLRINCLGLFVDSINQIPVLVFQAR